MKEVSGLRSRIRCRKGAKSGFANGMRMDSIIWPPSSVKRCLKAVSASVPGAHSLTRVTTRLLPFLAAHSPMIQDDCERMKLVRTKYGDAVVVTEAPEIMTTVGIFACVTSCP